MGTYSTWLGSSAHEKDLWTAIDYKLNIHCQGNMAVQKANTISGCTKRNTVST